MRSSQKNKQGVSAMGKRILRIFVFAMAVVMIFSITAFGAKVEKPKKITAILDDILKLEDGQDKFAKEYEKQTGIKLLVTQPPHQQYYEKLKLAFSTGDIPDVVEIMAPDYVNYALQGAFIPLDNYIKKSAVLKKAGHKYLYAGKVNGKVYGFPVDNGGGCVTYIRKDWLDKLGLKVPTTWEQFYKVMEAFTFKDPDGNGKNDTVGYTAPGVNGDIYLRDILQNAVLDFTVKNGKWVDGMAQPEFTKAMERFRKAYAAGIIDKEIFTNKTSTCRDKFYAGKVGIFTYWSGTRAIEMEESVQQGPSGKSASVIPIKAIKGSHYVNRVPVFHAITVKAKNPEGIFKYFIEYEHDGGKGQLLFSRGVEGVHYAKNGNEYKIMPSLSNPSQLFTKAYIHPAQEIVPGNDPFPIDRRITNSIKVFQASAVMQKLAPASQTLVRVGADLDALRQEVISKILIGEYTVNNGMALYVKKSQELGMAKILSEMNNK
jgi:putative aldouronate transport system substrate-binding protein